MAGSTFSFSGAEDAVSTLSDALAAAEIPYVSDVAGAVSIGLQIYNVVETIQALSNAYQLLLVDI